jgi:hypothetical protein
LELWQAASKAARWVFEQVGEKAASTVSETAAEKGVCAVGHLADSMDTLSVAKTAARSAVWTGADLAGWSDRWLAWRGGAVWWGCVLVGRKASGRVSRWVAEMARAVADTMVAKMV